MRDSHLLVVLLVIANLGTAIYNWRNPVHRGTVYVLTPLIDLLPEGPPLNSAEKSDLLSDLRHQEEARDIQKAYGYLGATLSLHDLLRGIESLERSQIPLQESQRQLLLQKLENAQLRHQELQLLQRSLIDLEQDIVRDVSLMTKGKP